MNPALLLYARITWLFALLTTIVLVNVAVWGLHRHPPTPVWHIRDANAERGRNLIRHYGCGSCHAVPGVRGAVGAVGPRLDRLTDRIYIAGSLPNIPHNLTNWITEPKRMDPQTAMPNLGVTEVDARDIAEYLLNHTR